MSGPTPAQQPADGTPGTPAGSPPKKRDLALLVFVGAVVLVVVGSLITAAALRNARPSPVVLAGAAVQGFFDALVAGDATKALSYAVAPPADQTLLNDDVLAAQRSTPMTDIKVVPSAGSTESFDITYSIGTRSFDNHVRTTLVGDRYQLEQVTGTVTLVMAGVHDLPVLVNGVETTSSTFDLFPGSYTFTTGLKNVDWGPDATTTVALNGRSGGPSLSPRVTAAGRQAFLTGARKLVSTCTAKHALNPGTTCPFGLRQPTSGPRVTESTVRWRVEGNPWKKLADPKIESFTGPGIAKAKTSMTFSVTCRFSTGEPCTRQKVSNDLTFAGDVTTDPMKVVLTYF